MRIWLITDRIVSAALFLVFAAAAAGILAGKKEAVLSVFFKLAGGEERARYEEEQIAGALAVFCGGLAVLEMLNLIFAETIYVPAACIAAAAAACVTMILYTDRHCRKRPERPAMDMGDEEVSEVTDTREESENEQEGH